MKIIGHRGARGIALENTLESFAAALETKPDAIEFDVRATKDGVIVLSHDDNLKNVSDTSESISKLTYAELEKVKLRNGQKIPTLQEVLQSLPQIPVIVEIKVRGHSETICKILDDFPQLDITIASFWHSVAIECKRLRPHLKAYLAESRHPFEVIQTAHSMKVDGLDLNYKLLNPLTYWWCRWRNLDIMVYTVNSKLIAGLIHRLYPKVMICTDRPDRFMTHPKRRKVSA